MASTASTLGFRVPASPAAIFQLLHAAIVTSTATASLYDPTSFQEQTGISEPATARVISFFLIALKAYEVTGALQDNRATYWVSTIGRAAAASLMVYCGGAWAKLAPLDLGSAAVLGICMAFSPPAAAAKAKSG
ncbi:Hypothetical predicted protein [Lecanosticta acicola]|uniref:Uncharacterized protein n=1 Tax=Lecanosticta acicola TaxID=111012 RepID=A0AAI8YVJ3_9PEZI|nr:Hypothetical predicted protein [Lecanosticta acicola]